MLKIGGGPRFSCASPAMQRPPTARRAARAGRGDTGPRGARRHEPALHGVQVPGRETAAVGQGRTGAPRTPPPQPYCCPYPCPHCTPSLAGRGRPAPRRLPAGTFERTPARLAPLSARPRAQRLRHGSALTVASPSSSAGPALKGDARGRGLGRQAAGVRAGAPPDAAPGNPPPSLLLPLPVSLLYTHSLPPQKITWSRVRRLQVIVWRLHVAQC